MKPLKCWVYNFGSYRELEFDFADQGLAGIFGLPGSGKSTLADIVPWICWGVTSKQGGVDEVRAWGCEEPTRGDLEIQLADNVITITRIRGKASQNDLFWTEGGDNMRLIRGKDMNDTQKMLTKRLGIDAELYLLVGYFSQFSDADAFFTARPKDRRDTLEKIADLSLPVLVAEKASEARKVAKRDVETLEITKAKNTGKLEEVIFQLELLRQTASNWELRHGLELEELTQQSGEFETEKARRYEKLLSGIEAIDAKIRPTEEMDERVKAAKAAVDKLTAIRSNYQKKTNEYASLKYGIDTATKEKEALEQLTGICPTCLGEAENANKADKIHEFESTISHGRDRLTTLKREASVLVAELNKESELNGELVDARAAQSLNLHLIGELQVDAAALGELESAPNVYSEQLEKLKATENPHHKQITTAEKSRKALEAQVSIDSAAFSEKSHRVASLTQIYDLSFVLRGELLAAAVQELEIETNRRLEKYFDAEVRVAFALDADKLDVEIQCRGHQCVFTQLSGGQRRTLSLCLAAALMKAASNRSGVSLGMVCFDEPFGGRLSGALVDQAFNFFQDLTTEYDSVLVIEHSPNFQLMDFDRRYDVELVGDHSTFSKGEKSDAKGVSPAA